MPDHEASASSRREFIKRVSIGAAFATPIVTSFSMSGMNVAAGGDGDGPIIVPNQSQIPGNQS